MRIPEHEIELTAIRAQGAPGGEPLTGNLANVPLAVDDVLLVQGRAGDISALKRGGELLVLDSTTDMPHSRKAPLALFTSALYAFRALALRDMQGMMRRGYSIVTTADGPRGLRSAGPGGQLGVGDDLARAGHDDGGLGGQRPGDLYASTFAPGQ